MAVPSCAGQTMLIGVFGEVRCDQRIVPPDLFHRIENCGIRLLY